MSAFIVDKNHIDAMVTAAKMDRDFSFYHDGKRYKMDTIDACNLIGQALTAQNYRSVNHRYSESDEVPEYQFSYNMNFKHVEIMKACQCYDYQACETDDYYETFAYAFSKTLFRSQAYRLPGYDAAKWEITECRSENVMCLSDMLR